MRITDDERRKIAKYIFLSREKNLLRDSRTKIASELVQSKIVKPNFDHRSNLEIKESSSSESFGDSSDSDSSNSQ